MPILGDVTTSTTGLTQLLFDLGEVVESVVGWVGDVANTIVTTPILMITTGFLVIGGAVGIFGRLLSKN